MGWVIVMLFIALAVYIDFLIHERVNKEFWEEFYMIKHTQGASKAFEWLERKKGENHAD
jgi:hypothetical protein